MGEYAVMTQLLSRSWVTNVYTPAADSGVDLVLLTKERKLRMIQVKTSRIYESDGTWFNNISPTHLQRDSTQPDMFYVLAEGHPPMRFMVFPANELLEKFRQHFTGICQGNLIEFLGGFPVGKKFQIRHWGPEERRKQTIEARGKSQSVDMYWNNWDLLK